MTSLTRIAYGSLVARHGRAREYPANQRRSESSITRAYAPARPSAHLAPDPGRRPADAGLRRLDELAEELRELLARLAAEAGVDLRGLDDRAGRGDEPVEARRRVELRDRPRGRVACGDPPCGRQVRAHRLRVELGPE